MLDLMIKFPDCWDGVRLDAEDHRSHMAYNVEGVCPSTHPVALPGLDLPIRYPILDPALPVSLAPLHAPSHPHADFMNGWDQKTFEYLVKNCINAGVDCGNDGLDVDVVAGAPRGVMRGVREGAGPEGDGARR